MFKRLRENQHQATRMILECQGWQGSSIHSPCFMSSSSPTLNAPQPPAAKGRVSRAVSAPAREELPQGAVPAGLEHVVALRTPVTRPPSRMEPSSSVRQQSHPCVAL